MTQRDRMVLMAIVLVAALGAGWLLLVSPARKQATQASGELTSARAQLTQAQTEVAEARSAKSQYRSAYASLAQLGQAVPTSPEVPALVYALDKASNSHHVEFASITNGSAGSGSTAPAAASSTAGAAAGAAGAAAAPFTQMPFTFAFAGNYQDLIHLLTTLERFTVQSPGGPVEVSGRLLTIQSIALGASGGSSSAGSSAASAPSEMSWSVTASAYVLAPTPVSASAPGAGGGATPSGGAASAPSGPAPAAAVTPAVVRANG